MKLLQKMFSLALAMLLVFGLTIANVGAEEPTSDPVVVDEGNDVTEDNDVTEGNDVVDPADDTGSVTQPPVVVPVFDHDRFDAYLETLQNTFAINGRIAVPYFISSPYDRDLLEVEVTGPATVSTDNLFHIIFNGAGTVTFKISYNGTLIKEGSVTIIKPAIVVDEKNPTVVVGEYVDLHVRLTPGEVFIQDAVDYRGLNVRYTTNFVRAEWLQGEDSAERATQSETIAVLRVHGVAEGEATLKFSDPNGEIDGLEMTVKVVKANTQDPVAPTAPTNPVNPTNSKPAVSPATGDTTNMAIYTTMLGMAVLGLGYVVYSKRKALEK